MNDIYTTNSFVDEIEHFLNNIGTAGTLIIVISLVINIILIISIIEISIYTRQTKEEIRKLKVEQEQTNRYLYYIYKCHELNNRQKGITIPPPQQNENTMQKTPVDKFIDKLRGE